MISFELSDELRAFRATAREFAQTQIRPQARVIERSATIPPELARAYVELGLAAVEVPEAYGGLGQGLLGRVVVDEELAAGDPGIALALPAAGPFAQALLTLGDDAARERYLAPLVASGRRGVVAWSEPKPRLTSFETQAKEDRETYRITGTKSEVVVPEDAGGVVVFARLEGAGRPRTAAFALSLPVAGVSFGARTEGLGLLAAPTREMLFSDVRANRDARIGEGLARGFDECVMETIGRIGLIGAGRAVGLARAAFELACSFAEERQAFGKPISHFQGLAFLIADMATRVEVMRSVVYRAAWAFDHAEREASKLAAMAVSECHEGAMFVANNAVQVLGGAGYTQDFLAEKWMRDAKSHMAYAMTHATCDLFVGRMGVDGFTPVLEEDAPLPSLQPVMI